MKNNICTVHKCEMEKKFVPILYGMPFGPIFGYTEAKESMFPNCNDKIIGGCIVRNDRKVKEYKYVCEQCNTNRRNWKKLHRSEIIFETSINIKEDIILKLNDLLFEIDKSNIQDNNYINCLSLPNGKYNIFVMNKITNFNITSLEIELNKETANIIIFINNENIISIKVKYKNQVIALWY